MEILKTLWANVTVRWMVLGVAIVLVVALILAAIAVRKEVKGIEQQFDLKFEQPPIVIEKYDSLEGKKMDSLDIRRAIEHHAADRLEPTRLQSWLDSLFN